MKASFHAEEDGLAGIQQLAHDTNLLFYGTEEGELGPARRAQTRAVDRLATDGAKLRQCHIEDACKAGTQGGGNPPPTPGRNPARFHVPLHEIRLPPRRKELNARSSGEEPIRTRGRIWY